jgi:DNA-binding PadR family transcriptional regulator
MTNAELAILTLVAEQPRHGYEIEAVIEERGMREWTEIGFSSIYYLLKKLAKAGLVQGRLAQTGQGPARKVYEITPAGRDKFRAAVLEALATPRRCYPPLQLGLANLPGVPQDEALAALGQYRGALVERLAGVRARWDELEPLPYYVEAMFTHSVALVEAELAWIEGFIRELGK